MELNLWHWLVVACALLVAEVFAPVAFFLWLAAAALVSAATAWLLPELGLVWQLMLFGIYAIVAIVIWLMRYRDNQTEDDSTLNQRNQQYLGEVLTVVEAIEQGHGRVKANDSLWKAIGPDCATGTRVKVVRVDGHIFEVEPIESTK